MNAAEVDAFRDLQGPDRRLAQYLIFGLKKVEGWLEIYSAEFIATLSEIQHRAGYAGGVGEIGVHHGKLFIVLLLTTSETEKAFAIDVFENQQLNTDGSGKGDRYIFLANVRRWTGSVARVQVMARSSLEVRPDEIVAECGKIRLISIDGGHTEQCAVNDLALAEAVLQDCGIVIIDDYFNPCWPDVSTGVAKYLARSDSKLRPFAVSPNKIYLCHPECAALYRSEIQRHFKRNKEGQMFGSAVDLFAARSPNDAQSVAAILRERLKESSIGPRLLSLKDYLPGTTRTWSRRTAGWRYRLSRIEPKSSLPGQG